MSPLSTIAEATEVSGSTLRGTPSFVYSEDPSVYNEREAWTNSDAGSFHSVLTEHYLDQIKDREARESARNNIDWLRAQGYSVRGVLKDGKYYVRFSTPDARPEMMSLRQFVKSKLHELYNKLAGRSEFM